jgi:NAD(P)-dependent dehydrogenase (short-subunit alcohol dehydrogenase family)
VQELGRLDVMVNNASVEHKMPFLETPLEVWEEIIAVNPRTHHQRLVGARGPGDADQLPLLRR